jgi:hypothetical protein
MSQIRYRIQKTGYRIQDTRYKIQDTEDRIQDTEDRAPKRHRSKLCPVLHGDTRCYESELNFESKKFGKRSATRRQK